MVRELGLAVTFTDLNFPTVKDKFDENGKLLDEAYNKRCADGQRIRFSRNIHRFEFPNG